MDRVTILGVRIARLTPTEGLSAIVRMITADGPPSSVVFVNAHTLNLAGEDPVYRAVLNRAALVLNDGIGVSLAARLQGVRFPANLNGSDFLPRLIALAAERGDRVYLLGARPGVARNAAIALGRRFPALQVAGYSDGFFPAEASPALAAGIRAARATLLLVALGNPAQERWLDEFLPTTGARVGVGVGAFFDFTAGNIRRAPRWLRALSMEWLYRLLREPFRLGPRYILGNPLFLGRVVAERLGQRRSRRKNDSG